jgi:D-3-phosphoglycerate dehydrogenase / 2-oxoglutarate reductase
MKSFRVLLYEDMHEAGKQILAEHAEIILAKSLKEEDLLALVSDVDAIIIRANGAITARLMDAAPRLKVIGRHGIGVDAIDLQAARQRGIVVCNTPTANIESVAEHVVGLMLAVSKKMVQADKALRHGRWEVRYEYIGQELFGRTLGLVGMGRIGTRVAEICRLGFCMPIVYYDLLHYPQIEKELGARRIPLDKLLSVADIVSVHVPLSPVTQSLIGREEFSRMKTGAIFINTARGPVVDEDALLEALATGKLAGAGMDVYRQEPARPDNPLFALGNVVATPHMAAHTDDALRMMSMIAKDVLSVLRGKEAAHRIV